MELETARLIRKENFSPEIFVFDLASKAVARKAQPGQFVQIRVNSSFDPFLRRPFSVASVSSDTFRIVFRIRGKGTKILSQLNEGDDVEVLGPLGNPFPLFDERDIIMVGGGVGIAPLFFLAQKLAPKNRLQFFFGARNRTELIMLKDFKKLTKNIAIATEDGSFGKKGKVTDLFSPKLQPPGLLAMEEPSTLVKPLIFACGPLPMLKVLQSSFVSIPVYGFLEERLGCGTGLCFGCAVKKKTGGYLRLCKEGPVVNLNEIEL